MPRNTCSKCKRPCSVCYCDALVQVSNALRVLIIQHPKEQKHPFNTGRMAHLCLSNSELIVAETLNASQLANIANKTSVLLYPNLKWLPNTATIDPSKHDLINVKHVEQLVVIDATWSKSKKILHLHHALRNLPRLNLQGNMTSYQRIRKSTIIDSLSTLESIVLALNMLEPMGNSEEMLKPFKMMIELQSQINANGVRTQDIGDHYN